MMFLVGLMGMMAVGATAFFGFDTPAADEDEENTPESSRANVSDEESDGDDIVDLLDDPESEPELRTAAEPDVLPDDAVAAFGSINAGDEGDDTLEGTMGLDQLNGYQGDDVISGLEGEDILHGSEGEDSLFGDEGNDTLHGGDGNDQLWGSDDNDALFGHDGEDSLFGEDGNDSLVGSAGDDDLSGGAGDDALHGGLDDDTLHGGSGADTLFGGWGDDLISGLPADGSDEQDTDYLNGGGGDDMIIAGNGDIVTAGEGADTIAVGDWINQDHQAQILDYTASEDSLMVVYDDLTGEDPDVDLQQDESDSSLQHIVLNGVRIAVVADAEGLTLDQIVLVGKTVLNDQTAA